MRPWTEDDSVTAWTKEGAVIQHQQQQQQAAAPGGAMSPATASGVSNSGSAGGLSVSIGGQQVDSWEVLLDQLLTANRQQEAASAAASAGSAVTPELGSR